MRLFYQAGRVRVTGVPAGLVGAALADLAFPVDGGFPGGFGDLADRGLLAGAERPPDRPGDLVAAPGREPVQLLHEVVAGVGPSQVTMILRCSAGGRTPMASRSSRR